MTIRSDLKRAAEAVMGMDYPWDHTVRDGRLGKTSTEYARLAHPSNVLALIEHNELLTARLCECKSCGGEGDLHSGDWHHYGHMEPPEPVMEKCGGCDGTGLLGEVQDLYQVITERDQLRAEISGLKTGYEAYERVNAELKAEVEALRKLGPSKEIIWCACGDGYPVNSYGAGFMAANGDVCENCDAANGRVEPHLDTPDELKALRQALTDIFNHVEGNTECLVRDLVNWGTPRINPNDFYDECEAIKEIANAALGKGGQS